MGRKKKNTTDKNGYFYEEEENAFRQYINSEDKEEKEIIFNKWLKPAFTKMIESIIRRYNLYPPDETFQETFDDTLSFLLTKINNYNLDSNFKAYSYCGTICKNYLILKINQSLKNQKRNASYDIIQNEINDNIKFAYNQNNNYIQMLNDIINETVSEIKVMLEEKDKNKLSENEIKVGNGLVKLLENWEDLFARMGSNKFNKSSILLFLKEMTFLNTNEIRDGMKKYKFIYQNIRKKIFYDNYM